MNEISNNQRLHSIDILRAIGIISIVIGHACNEYNFAVSELIHNIKNFVYTYHLMIFVFCSGYLIKYDKEIGAINYLKKKLNGYYKKFLFFSINLLWIKILFKFMGIYDYNIVDLVKYFVRSLLFVSNGDIAGALWFLQLLFIVSIIHMGITIFFNKIEGSTIIRFVTIIILGFVGLLLNSNEIVIPYRIDAAFMSLPIMECGYQMQLKGKKYIDKCFCNNFAIEILIFFIISLILFSVVKIFDYSIDIAKCYTKPILGFYMVSFLGIMWCISLLHIILKTNYIKVMLSMIGKNSAFIMAYHFTIFKIFDFVYYIYNGHQGGLNIHPYSYPQLRVYYVLGGVAIPILVNFLLQIMRFNYDIKKK